MGGWNDELRQGLGRDALRIDILSGLVYNKNQCISRILCQQTSTGRSEIRRGGEPVSIYFGDFPRRETEG